MGSAPHQMSGITAHRLNTTSQTLRRSWNSNERVRTTLFYRTGYAVCPNAPNVSTGGRTLTVLGGRRTQLSYPCATTIREGRLAARCRYPLVGLRRPSRCEEERVSPPGTKKPDGEGWFPLCRARLVSIAPINPNGYSSPQQVACAVCGIGPPAPTKAASNTPRPGMWRMSGCDDSDAHIHPSECGRQSARRTKGATRR